MGPGEALRPQSWSEANQSEEDREEATWTYEATMRLYDNLARLRDATGNFMVILRCQAQVIERGECTTQEEMEVMRNELRLVSELVEDTQRDQARRQAERADRST